MKPIQRLDAVSQNTQIILAGAMKALESKKQAQQNIQPQQPTLASVDRIPLKQASQMKEFSYVGMDLYKEADSKEGIGRIWVRKEEVDPKTGAREEWLVVYTNDDDEIMRQVAGLHCQAALSHEADAFVDHVVDYLGHYIYEGDTIRVADGRKAKVLAVEGPDVILVEWANYSPLRNDIVPPDNTQRLYVGPESQLEIRKIAGMERKAYSDTVGENYFINFVGGASGMNVSPATFAFRMQEGGTQQRSDAVRNIIKSAPADPQSVANALNNSGLGFTTWAGTETPTGMKLSCKDTLGNAHYLILNKKPQAESSMSKNAYESLPADAVVVSIDYSRVYGDLDPKDASQKALKKINDSVMDILQAFGEVKPKVWEGAYELQYTVTSNENINPHEIKLGLSQRIPRMFTVDVNPIESWESLDMPGDVTPKPEMSGTEIGGGENELDQLLDSQEYKGEKKQLIDKYLDQLSQATAVGDQQKVEEIRRRLNELSTLSSLRKKIAAQAQKFTRTAAGVNPKNIPIAPGIKSKNISMDETGGTQNAKVTIEFTDADKGLDFYQNLPGTSEAGEPKEEAAEAPQQQAQPAAPKAPAQPAQPAAAPAGLGVMPTSSMKSTISAYTHNGRAVTKVIKEGSQFSFINEDNLQVNLPWKTAMKVGETFERPDTGGMLRVGGYIEMECDDDVISSIVNEIVGILEDATDNPIEGGIGDDLDLSKQDPEQVSKGKDVEKEHTKDDKVSLDIVKDHLAEDPKYYDKLEKMEKGKKSSLKKQAWDEGALSPDITLSSILANVDEIIDQMMEDYAGIYSDTSSAEDVLEPEIAKAKSLGISAEEFKAAFAAHIAQNPRYRRWDATDNAEFLEIVDNAYRNDREASLKTNASTATGIYLQPGEEVTYQGRSGKVVNEEMGGYNVMFDDGEEAWIDEVDLEEQNDGGVEYKVASANVTSPEWLAAHLPEDWKEMNREDLIYLLMDTAYGSGGQEGSDISYPEMEAALNRYQRHSLGVVAKIIKRKGKFVVTDSSGKKTLGKHRTKKKAIKQLRAIEINKHKKTAADISDTVPPMGWSTQGEEGSPSGAGPALPPQQNLQPQQNNVLYDSTKDSGPKFQTTIDPSGKSVTVKFLDSQEKEGLEQALSQPQPDLTQQQQPPLQAQQPQQGQQPQFGEQEVPMSF